MIQHYFSVALRALRRDIGYATINVTGLAVGMACCLLILVYIVDELSYDQFHEKSDRIVRLALETKGGDGEWRGRVPAFYQLAELVGENLSGVETTAQIARDRALLAHEGRQFMEENILMASRSLFDVFSVTFLRGSPETAFENPYSAVLTEAAAQKYFGNADPVGQTITRNNKHEFEVTAVVDALPVNSHFQFDVLLNLDSTRDRYRPEMFESMGAQWVYTYLLMAQPESAASIDLRVNNLVSRFIPPDTPVEVRLVAQPLTEIHLHSRFEAELAPNGDVRYLYVFGVIAVFILVIACVNFMNLATARASLRAREVGVRKLLGAHRSQLVRQFLAESAGMSLLAVVFALGLATLALPLFNSVTGKEIPAAGLFHPEILASLLGIALFVGLLSGSYPAFFLSSFRPARVLKGTLESGRAGAAFRLRQGLVVFQFGISIAIVLGSFVVYNQLDFMQNTYPGFDRDQVLSIRLPGSMRAEDIETLKARFVQQPGVQHASAASHAPPEGLNSWRVRSAGTSADNNELISWIAVDHDYVETLGLEMAKGRAFRRDSPADAGTAIMINEAMASFYNLEDPVGQVFEFESNHFSSGSASVIGVVQDYHQTSLHEEIRPVLFFLDTYARQILLKMDTERLAGTIEELAGTWSSVVTDWPFEYSLLDDRFDALYNAEQRLGRIFRIFSFLAVFVACMGLFGLSAYMAERRTREVGVRKAFGASVRQLVGLLTRDFLVLVLIAYVIAAPLTWIGMQSWLEDFAYRAEFGAGLFVLTAGLAISIAAITVSYQAVRAALMNPVETLRYE